MNNAIHLSKKHESSLGVGKEVNEEDNTEGLKVPGRQKDRVTEHTHASIKLQHLDELECRKEHNHGQNEAKYLIPDGNCDKIHILSWKQQSKSYKVSGHNSLNRTQYSSMGIHGQFGLTRGCLNFP